MTWNLVEAEKDLDEVVRRASCGDPQRIATSDGAVIVIAEAEYERLLTPRRSITDVMATEPDFDHLDLARDPIRKI